MNVRIYAGNLSFRSLFYDALTFMVYDNFGTFETFLVNHNHDHLRFYDGHPSPTERFTSCRQILFLAQHVSLCHPSSFLANYYKISFFKANFLFRFKTGYSLGRFRRPHWAFIILENGFKICCFSSSMFSVGVTTNSIKLPMPPNRSPESTETYFS